MRRVKDKKGPECSQPSRMLRSNSGCAAMAGDIVSKTAQPICDGNGVFERVKLWYCVTCRSMMLHEAMGDVRWRMQKQWTVIRSDQKELNSLERVLKQLG